MSTVLDPSDTDNTSGVTTPHDRSPATISIDALTLDVASVRARAARLPPAQALLRRAVERLLAGQYDPAAAAELAECAHQFGDTFPDLRTIVDHGILEWHRRHPPRVKSNVNVGDPNIDSATRPHPDGVNSQDRFCDPISETTNDNKRLEYEKQVNELRVKLLPDLREFLGTEDPNDDDSVCWIVRDLIPREEPAIIGGPQKAGKTWLMLDLAISVALGLPWAGFKNELARPGRVLTVCLEDHKIRLRNRVWELLRARRMTPNDPTFQEHFRITDHAIALPAHASLMAAALADFAPDLILVDNLRRVMTGDENDSKDAARFNAAWLELSRALRCSVVFLHHTRKAGTQRGNDDMRASDKLRGSGDISAFARNLVMVEPRSDGGNRACSTVEIAGNLDLKRSKFVLEFERVALSVEPGAPQRHVARLSDAGDVTEFEQDRKRNRDSAEMDRARAAARELGLAGRTISSRALELLVGCKKTRAAELLAQLAEEGFVAQTGPRKSYSLVGG